MEETLFNSLYVDKPQKFLFSTTQIVSSSNITCINQFSSVQSLSRVWLFATPWIAARQASLSSTSTWSSLRLTSIESVMPSSHLILCRPLLLLPPIPPSIRVLSNESTFRMMCINKVMQFWVALLEARHKFKLRHKFIVPTDSVTPGRLWSTLKSSTFKTIYEN